MCKKKQNTKKDWKYHTQINSRWITDLSKGTKTTKFLGENIRE